MVNYFVLFEARVAFLLFYYYLIILSNILVTN